MIRITSGFHKLVFKDAKLRQDLEAEFVEIMTEAIREFFLAMVDKVPVATGMARASIQDLATWLNETLEIERKRFGPWADARYAQGFSLGAPKPPDGYFGQGYVRTDRNQYGVFKYWFDWYTLVEHWHYLETENNPQGNHPPWKALQAGYKAFNRYLTQALNKKKIVKSYIDFAELDLGSGGSNNYGG